jgi:hypothetical protein
VIFAVGIFLEKMLAKERRGVLDEIEVFGSMPEHPDNVTDEGDRV